MKLKKIGEAFFNGAYGSFIRSPQGKWVRVTQARIDETFKKLLEQTYQETHPEENQSSCVKSIESAETPSK